MKVTAVSKTPSPVGRKPDPVSLKRNRQIYVYPIKALRPISLRKAQLTPQGVQHDRRFMICRIDDAEPSKLTKVQIDKNHDCGLFKQEIKGDSIHVSYMTPKEPVVPAHPYQRAVLQVPLDPATSDLEPADVDLHLSMVTAFRMGGYYDAWFSACFGFNATLVYIGSGRRPVLGTYAPPPAGAAPQRGWLSTVAGYVAGGVPQASREKPWINFSDLAPFLVASNKSLDNVQARLTSSSVDMTAFRPNIVVDGESEFDEDFWAELSTHGEPFLTLTKMCGRCNSLNVDYSTGKVADGERGTLLKKLMSDRRVDKGAQFAPVFGKYAFLSEGRANMVLSVGDEVVVTKRAEDRPVFDWPRRTRGAQPQSYQYS